MSIRATNRVWADASVSGPRRMLLLAIADYANDEGTCWPSMRCLAERTCLTVRRVQQLMRELEKAGYITIVPAKGRGTFNVIRINEFSNSTSTALPHAGDVKDASCGKMDEEAFALPARMGEEAFTHSPGKGAEAFTHSPEKDEETFTHFTSKRAKVSAQRVKLSTQRAKLSAQKGETLSHTREDPSLIHTNNQQQIQRSVLFASLSGDNAVSEEPAAHVHPVDGDGATCTDTDLHSAPTLLASPTTEALSDAVARVVKSVAEECSTVETPQQKYFKLLCWIVGADHAALSRNQKGEIAQTMGILQKAGYSEDDLRAFWHVVWKKDWRWTNKGSRPSLNQVRAEIGKLRVDKQAEALAMRTSTGRDEHGKPILTAEEKQLQALMREARERARLRKEDAKDQGLRLPDLQGHEVGLSGPSAGTSGLRQSLSLPVPRGD